MPRLILSMDGLVLKEIVLDKEKILIGRKPSNDIQIDNLAISGEHAMITTILEDAFLEDRNSTNGTFVNGQPVKKHVLTNNDVIELGKYRLKFLKEASSSVEKETKQSFIDSSGLSGGLQAGAEGTVVADFGQTPAMEQTPVVPAPVAPGTPARPQIGVIQILSGSNAGRELELSKSVTTLGKPGLQVAVITKRPHGYFITHVEGATFPLVNGRVLDSQANRLNEHDIIQIAGVKMEFFLKAVEEKA